MLAGLEFDHVGIPTYEVQPNEDWVESTHVWVTNPRTHQYRIEYLRYEADSPAPVELKTLPHVAYRVQPGTLDEWTHSLGRVLLEPFEAQTEFVRVSFVFVTGGAVEFMEFKGDPNQWFPGQAT